MRALGSISPLVVDIAARVTQLKFGDIPKSVIENEKKSLVDTLAVSWAASEQTEVNRVVTYIARLAGGRESTVWALDERAPVGYAALANGALAAALDYDSLQEEALVHADICVLPAAVAMAERGGKSGPELLAAAAIGSELACRLGLAAANNSGWFYTSIFGCFGAAAACAKLLELDEDGTRNALSIVMSRAAGTQQPAVERVGTKRMQSAFAAQAGVESALLASAGMSGPKGAIDGEFGLFRKYEGGDAEIVLDKFGEKYFIERRSYKKFPCCACSHAAIEAALALRHENGLSPEEIDQVEVKITPYMARLVGGAFDPSSNPTVCGQFSVRYGVAAALLRGSFGVVDIGPEKVMANDVKVFADRIDVSTFEEYDGRLAPAKLTVVLRNGMLLSKQVDKIAGSPESPMSEEEFYSKIRDCTSRGPYALSSEQYERLLQAIRTLDAMDDIGELFPRVLRG